MTAPSRSELAQWRFEDNVPTCLDHGHQFDSSRETNEPIGRCHRCGITVDGAERLDEARAEAGAP